MPAAALASTLPFTPWLATLLSVAAVSSISLLGVIALAWAPQRLNRITGLLVSLAIGGLLGDAFLHLLPESIEGGASPRRVSVCMLAGVLAFFLLERLLRHRLYHLHEHHAVRPVVWMNLLGDGLHNFVDGMLISASWAAGDVRLGVTTTLAVVLHEIPQEIGDFGVLVHGGLSVRRALALNFLSALTAFLGAAVVLVFRPEVQPVQTVLVPVTAGGFLYIAGSDLIPELNHEDVDLRTSVAQFGLVAVGIGIMAAFLLVPS